MTPSLDKTEMKESLQENSALPNEKSLICSIGISMIFKSEQKKEIRLRATTTNITYISQGMQKKEKMGAWDQTWGHVVEWPNLDEKF